MFEKVREIISDKLGINKDKITLKTSFRDDLEVDSLSLFELVMAFEDEFNIEIDDEHSDNIETVGDVVRHLEELLK